MLPTESETLPEGSDPQFVEELKLYIAASEAPESGTITLIVDGRVIGHMAWTGTPMFKVMECFGAPFNGPAYHTIMDTRSDVECIPGAVLFTGPDGMGALVQSQQGMTLEEAEGLLRKTRS